MSDLDIILQGYSHLRAILEEAPLGSFVPSLPGIAFKATYFVLNFTRANDKR